MEATELWLSFLSFLSLWYIGKRLELGFESPVPLPMYLRAV